MQHVTEARPTVTSLLLMWIRHHLARHAAAMRAKPRAVAVAAYTAGTGNPPGA